MKTHKELLGMGDGIHDEANYLGDIIADNWPILLARARDSDCLDRANWDAAIAQLGGGESKFIKIYRSGSWACGWLEYLCVCADDPETMEKASEIETELENYPVLDGDLFSQYEQDEANSVWRNCYTVRERVAYIRKHKPQIEFRDFADLLSCVRGNYFAGHASELIN